MLLLYTTLSFSFGFTISGIKKLTHSKLIIWYYTYTHVQYVFALSRSKYARRNLFWIVYVFILEIIMYKVFWLLYVIGNKHEDLYQCIRATYGSQGQTDIQITWLFKSKVSTMIIHQSNTTGGLHIIKLVLCNSLEAMFTITALWKGNSTTNVQSINLIVILLHLESKSFMDVINQWHSL